MKANLFSGLWALLAASNILLCPSAIAAVDVFGEAEVSDELTTVRLYGDIAEAPILSFCVKLTYDPANLEIREATKNSDLWYFSDGEKRYDYMDPQISQRGQIVILGGLLDGKDPLQGVIGKRILLGTAVFKRLNSDPPKFQVSPGYPAPFNNFVTTAGKAMEASFREVTHVIIGPPPPLRLSIQWRADRDLSILLTGKVTHPYALEQSMDLRQWNTLTTNRSDAYGGCEWVAKPLDPLRSSPWFFRAREVPFLP